LVTPCRFHPTNELDNIYTNEALMAKKNMDKKFRGRRPQAKGEFINFMVASWEFPL